MAPRLKPLLLLLLIASSQQKKPTMNIRSVFYPAGKIASPVHYETVVLQVNLESYIEATPRVEEQLQQLQAAYPHRNVSDALSPHLHRLQEASKQAEIALRYFSSQPREKRQAALLAAVGLGALVSVGSALFGHSEVERMGEQLRHEHQHLRHLDHRVSELRDLMKNKLSTIAERFAADEALAKAAAIISQICSEIEAAVESYFSLASHKIHPGLIPPRQLQNISDRVQSSAKEKGVVPAVQVSDALMHLPLSWILREKGVQLFLHVPMIPEGKGHVRQLFWLHSAIKTTGHEVKKLTGDEDFISLGHHKGTYVVHTTGELELCHRMLNLRLCTEPTTHHRQRRHCIAGLYHKDSGIIHDHCKETSNNQDLPLIDYATKQFFVQTGEKARIYCGDNETRPFSLLKRGEIIEMEDGCELQGDTFHLYMPHQNHIEAEIQEVVRQVPVLRVTDDTMSAIDAILKTMGNIPAEQLPEEPLEDDARDDGGINGFDAGLIGVAIGSVLTMTFILYCICKRRRIGRLLRQQSRRQTDHDEDRKEDVPLKETTAGAKEDVNSIFSPPELGEGDQEAEGRTHGQHDQQGAHPQQPGHVHPVTEAKIKAGQK
jgi:hypothetical protein